MINNLRFLALGLLVVACQKAPSSPTEFQGVIEFEEQNLAFEVPGRIEKLLVREGDVLEVDQLVATLADSVEQTLLKAREAELAAARSQSDLVASGARPAQIRALKSAVAAAKANYDQLTRQYEREKSLFTQGITTQERIDQIETSMLMAKATMEQRQSELVNLELGSRKQEVEGARQKSEALDLSTSAEKQRLDKYSLRSAAAGTVLDVHYKQGEVAPAGAHVITLARKGESFIEVFVPQQSMDSISLGKKAEVFVDATAAPFSAVVTHIARNTEFTPRYIFSVTERSKLVIRVRLALDDPTEKLHAGVPARARFL